jgi:hypothetical protein
LDCWKILAPLVTAAASGDGEDDGGTGTGVVKAWSKMQMQT